MCGLFGWVGSDPKQFNRDKFDKLGIYNVQRGKHSCGVAIDGEVYKGIGKTSEYIDFIIHEKYPNPKDIPVVIGHTRQATSGLRTIENAHPFKFEQEDGKYMIGAHNGSLTNEKGLAQKYNIELGDKIDSQVLIECLSKGHIEVLEDYKGAAALLIFDTEEKDTLYIYRGASKRYKSSSVIEDERPLFFYKESKDSIYVSSIADSLKAIVNPDQDPEEVIFEVVPNRIYEIHKGEIKNRYIVKRERVWEKDVTYKHPLNNTRKNNTNNIITDTNRTSKVGRSTNENSTPIINDERELNLFYEKITHQESSQLIYYENGRYKRSGHLANGVFVFTEEFGFLKVSENLKNIDKDLKSVSYLDKDINEIIALQDLSNAKLFYMHNGVLLKHEADFMACLTHMNNTDYKNLSWMSEYPIINYKNNLKVTVKRNEQGIILADRLYTGTWQPIGSHCEYEAKNGILIRKEVFDDINLPDSQDDYITIYENIDDIEDDDDDTFEESMTKSLITGNNDELMDAILEAGMQISETQSIVSDLSIYKSDDILVKTILEYNANCIKSFEPIAQGIEELKELRETNEIQKK